MSDLISRKALLPAIENYFEPINSDYPMTLTVKQIREVLNLLSAVDAVEVVRCRDCKYRDNCEIRQILVYDCELQNPYCAAGVCMDAPEKEKLK